METYFISDLHFGHDAIIRYDKRPFFSIKEMDDTLISNWNKRVKYNDIVYILGDISFAGNKETVEILNSLNGTKSLIIGNHDFIQTGSLSKSVLKEAVTEKTIYWKDKTIFMSHYPFLSWENQYKGFVHLYGHVHKNKQYESVKRYKQDCLKHNIPCEMFNVGCMINYMNYTPRTIEEILKGDG